jgi:hypothetical protein
MMIVPDAANMPPTPWQTVILASGIWAGATRRIWRTLSCKACMPTFRSACRRPPPLVLSGSLLAGAVLRSEVAGALGRDQDQGAAAVGHQAALHSKGARPVGAAGGQPRTM